MDGYKIMKSSNHISRPRVGRMSRFTILYSPSFSMIYGIFSFVITLSPLERNQFYWSKKNPKIGPMYRDTQEAIACQVTSLTM